MEWNCDDSIRGELPLDEVEMAADAIDTAFGTSRFWSDEEVRALLLKRTVPARISHPSDAAELSGRATQVVFLCM